MDSENTNFENSLESFFLLLYDAFWCWFLLAGGSPKVGGFFVARKASNKTQSIRAVLIDHPELRGDNKAAAEMINKLYPGLGVSNNEISSHWTAIDKMRGITSSDSIPTQPAVPSSNSTVNPAGQLSSQKLVPAGGLTFAALRAAREFVQKNGGEIDDSLTLLEKAKTSGLADFLTRCGGVDQAITLLDELRLFIDPDEDEGEE